MKNSSEQEIKAVAKSLADFMRNNMGGVDLFLSSKQIERGSLFSKKEIQAIKKQAAIDLQKNW